MNVSLSMYRWLKVTAAGTTHGELVQLAQEDLSRLIKGTFVADLVTRKLFKGKPALLADINQGVREVHPSLENWTVLLRALAKLGLVFDGNTRAGLLTGDIQALKTVLDSLKQREELPERPTKFTYQTGSLPTEALTWLDWTILIISQSLNFNWKKAAKLVIRNSPDLQKPFLTGIKKQFDRPLAALAQASAYASTLISLLENEPEWLGFVLTLFSCALESKSLEVKVSALNFYLEVHLHSLRVSAQLEEAFRRWLIDSEAYLLVVSGLELEPSLAAALLTGSDQISELFLSLLPEQLLHTEVLRVAIKLLDFCPAEQAVFLDSPLSNILEHSLKEQPQLVTAELLCDIWLRSPSPIEGSDQTLWQTLFFTSRAIEQLSITGKTLVWGKLFAIASKHNTSEVFNYLLGLLEESSEDACLREFLTQNFVVLISGNPPFNLSQLLKEAVKLLNQCELSLFDYQFFLKLIPIADLETGFAFTEFFLKDYFDSLSKPAVQLITGITAKFIKTSAFQEFLGKSVASTLKSLRLRILKGQEYNLFLSQVSILLRSLANVKHRAFNKTVFYNLCACTKRIESELSEVPRDLSLLLHYFRKRTGLLPSHQKQTSALVPGISERHSRLQRHSIMSSGLMKMNSHLTPTLRTPNEERWNPSMKSFGRFLRPTASRAVSRLKQYAIPSNKVEFIDIEEESEFDQSLVYIVLQRYSTITRALYRNYTASMQPLTPGSFERNKCLKMGEACKMLRENSVSPEMISTDKLRRLYMAVLGHMKCQALDYEGFLTFLYHVAVTVYSVSPLDLSHYPTAVSLRALFESIAQSGIYSLSTFAQPVEDPELLTHLNSELASNKDYQLPAGYKRVTEQHFSVNYVLPDVVPRTSTTLCLEVLDSMLNSVFRMHIIEPLLTVHTVYRAVPVHQPIMVAKPMKNALQLTYNLKATLSKLSSMYPQDLLLECAKVIDDLVQTTDRQSQRIYTRNPDTVVKKKVTTEAKPRAHSELKRRHRTRQVLPSLRDKLGELSKLPTQRMRQYEHRAKRSSPVLPPRHISPKPVRKRRESDIPSQEEIAFNQALSDNTVKALAESFDNTYAMLVKTYSTGIFISPLHCSILAKDLGIVPALLDSYVFNRLVIACSKAGQIGQRGLHSVMLRVALSVRTQLEVLLDCKLNAASEVYTGLLQYLRIPQDPSQLQLPRK